MVLTSAELHVTIRVLGGPTATARMLGCSDTLIRHLLAGRRLLTAEKALRLRELITEVNSTLPGIAYNLKVAAQQAETRRMQWRARRPRWQPPRSDKTGLSALERRNRRCRDQEVAERVAAGERTTALAEEYGAQPRTIMRWARRGSRHSGTPT